jgi:hypothetical protein
MTMGYELKSVPVVEGVGTSNQLIVHMCNAGGEDMVEFFVEGQTVVLRRTDFEQMAAWVNLQFSILGRETRSAN